MTKHSNSESQPIEVLEIIADELIKLAGEFEDLPQCACTEMTNETMMRLQRIDFCSQRLQDLSTLVSLLSKRLESNESSIARSLAESARLEYTRELFAS